MKYPVAVLSMFGGFVWASGGDSVDNVPQEALGVYEAYTKASNAMINRAREEYKTRLNQFLKAKMKTDNWDTMIQIKKKISWISREILMFRRKKSLEWQFLEYGEIIKTICIGWTTTILLSSICPVNR